MSIFCLVCAGAWGQASPPSSYTPSLITYNGTPFGICDVYQVALDVTQGNFYSCNPRTHAFVLSSFNPAANFNFTGNISLSNGLVLPSAGPSLSQLHTIPAVSPDVFGLLAAVQTFSNKTFTAPIASTIGPSAGQQHTIPAVTSDTFGLLAAVQTFTNKTVDISANTLKNSSNTAGHVPRNNGTQYVDGQLGAADLSDGVTGTGAVVRGTTPTIATPVLNGTPTGTSLQGSDSLLMTAGTVSASAGVALCTDANHGATTSGCAAAPSLATLNKQDTQGSATTGTGSAQTVFTYTMPAGTLGSGKCLNITGFLQKVSGTNSLAGNVAFGGTVLLNTSGSGNTFWEFVIKVCNNTGSTTAQWASGHVTIGSTSSAVNAFSPAEDTGNNSVVIIMHANVASPDTWKGIGWTVITDP